MRFQLGSAPYPAGTNVGVYDDSNRQAAQQREAPRSTAVRTAAVQPNGTLDVTGLEADTAYWFAAQVDGAWTWVKFRTEPSKTARFESTDPEDVTFRSDAPADQSADVFQQYIGGDKVVSIDGDGVLHLTGVNAGGEVLQRAVTIVQAGDQTGTYALDVADETEVWLFLTLTGDLLVTIANLAAGQTVRIFVTQDATGDRVLTVTDGIVSIEADADGNPDATTALVLRSPDGDQLFLAGGSDEKPPRELTAGRTIDSTDLGRLLKFTTAGTVDLKVPSGLVPEVGDEVEIVELGPGEVRVTADPGVKIWAPGDLRGVKRGGRALLQNIGAQEHVLAGDLVAVSSFNPLTDVPSLSLWHDARQLAATDGDVLTQYVDHSGAGHHGAQATSSKRAIYRAGAENGLPSDRFDGVDDYYAFAGIHNDTAARTIFAVAALVGAATHVHIVWGLTNQGHVLQLNGGHWYFARNQADAVVDLGAATSLDVITIRFNDVGSCDAYLNGVFVTNFDPHDGYQVGGHDLAVAADAGGNFPFQGDIPELIVSDSAVTNTVRANCEAYLLSKWRA